MARISETASREMRDSEFARAIARTLLDGQPHTDVEMHAALAEENIDASFGEIATTSGEMARNGNFRMGGDGTTYTVQITDQGRQALETVSV